MLQSVSSIFIVCNRHKTLTGSPDPTYMQIDLAPASKISQSGGANPRGIFAKTAWKGKKLDREGSESLAPLWIRHCQLSSSRHQRVLVLFDFSRKLLQSLEGNVGFVPLSYMPRVQPETDSSGIKFFCGFGHLSWSHGTFIPVFNFFWYKCFLFSERRNNYLVIFQSRALPLCFPFQHYKSRTTTDYDRNKILYEPWSGTGAKVLSVWLHA